ncbi:MAG: MarR family transcriptional regulator [Nocardiopsaceae bacterium]|nr:MarR family transcriptional regulator [Nocardiopsaceae bacterium]
MPTSRDLPSERLAIGQLLVRLLRQFRDELSAPAAQRGYTDLRQPHLHIFGNVGIDGVRLTELAERAQLSLATTSELVTELQDMGYLERRQDPADGRAKLIFPTRRGGQALDDAADRVAEIEQHWRDLAGSSTFDTMCQTMQYLLDALAETAPSTQPARSGLADQAG